MNFGKPTMKLLKLLKSRLTLGIFVISCIVFVLIRSGKISYPDRLSHGESGLEKGGSALGSGLDRILIATKHPIQPTGNAQHSTTTLVNEFKQGQINKQDDIQGKEDLSVLNRVGKHLQKSFLQLVKEASPPISLQSDKYYKTDQLKVMAQHMNENQFILNKEKFTKRLKNDVVIVIQVHKRIEYLIELLASLEKVKGINNVLLIISSDWYSDSIIEAIKKVEFCQVMHIFFPFAEQLHPDSFPGTDPNDCPREIDTTEARQRKCINAEHPDKYGHFREAKFTMTKHHWWWKANAVFDKLTATKNTDGPVVFLEEDHFVGPDFYHSLIQLHELKQNDERCHKSCDILSPGMYVTADNYFSNAKSQVTLTRWRSYDHNMGMTMYRSTWEKIKKCTKIFCTHDDYNWDWTLMQISMSCLDEPLHVLAMDLPRIFHVGECGMHHKGDCNAQKNVNAYKELIERNADAFFPKELVISNVEDGGAHAGMENGGWGDKRDHALCESFVKLK